MQVKVFAFIIHKLRHFYVDITSQGQRQQIGHRVLPRIFYKAVWSCIYTIPSKDKVLG